MKTLLNVMRGFVLGCGIVAMIYSTKGDAAEASGGVLYLVTKPSDKSNT